MAVDPPTISPPETARLHQLANTLRASEFFRGTTADYPLVEKQALFLVIASCKPVSEATSGHWVSTPDGRHTVADDPSRVAAFLEALGLYHDMRSDAYGTTAYVALSPDLLSQSATALANGDAATAGRLFGYPETAVQAFGSGNLLPIEEQETRERAAGLHDAVTFRCSQNHWADELRVAADWQQVLRTFDLLQPF